MNWYKRTVLASGGFPAFSRGDFIKALKRVGVICTKANDGSSWDLKDPINNTKSTLHCHDLSGKDLFPGVVKDTIKYLGISADELLSGKRQKKEIARPTPSDTTEVKIPSWQQSAWFQKQKDLGMTG